MVFGSVTDCGSYCVVESVHNRGRRAEGVAGRQAIVSPGRQADTGQGKKTPQAHATFWRHFSLTVTLMPGAVSAFQYKVIAPSS